MNASLALCAAMLSALPAADPSLNSESVYPAPLSRQFHAVIRGQNPGPVLTTPMLTVPTGPVETTVMAPPSGPIVSQGVPSTYGPAMTGSPSPFGVTQPVPSDPYMYDPGYLPGGALQEHRWGWYVGYDNVIVKPYFSRNPAVSTVTGGTIDSQNLDWGFTYSPRVWLGLIEPNGTGMMVRYWQFDDGDEQDGGRQSLDMDVIDAEKQWHFSTKFGAVSVGGGFRYASIDGKLISNGVGANDVSFDRNFNGFGPTLAISGRRRVNNSNWSLFASGRLSGLYGRSSMAIVELVPGGDAAYASGNEMIGVTDLQFGVDWSAPVWHQTHLFVRIAGEGQLWYGGGLPSATASDGGYNLTGPNGNLGFFGFTVGTGLTF